MARSIHYAVRTPLLVLTLLALAALLLLQLERTGAAAPGPSVGVPGIAAVNVAHKDKPVPPKHCTDGKGKDAEKNKNCQISQG